MGIQKLKKDLIHNHKLAVMLFLLLVLYKSMSAFYDPRYNWDLLGYMGAVLQIEGGLSIDELHQKVFEEAKKTSKFAKLVDPKNEYKKTMYEDSEAYTQQLAYYNIRVVYNIINYLLYKGTSSLLAPTRIVSLASFLLICILMAVWLNPYVRGIHFLWILPVILYGSSLPTISRLSTPDGLSALVIVSSFYCYYEKKYNFISMLLLVLSIGVRTDNIILVLLFLLVNKVFRKQGWFVVTGIASLFVYLVINYYFEHHGWGTTLYHGFIENLMRPAEFDGSITISQYMGILLKGTKDLLQSKLIMFLIVPPLLYVFWGIRNDHGRDLLAPMIIVLSSIFSHWILFPVTWHRMYVGYYVVILVMIFRSYAIAKWRDPFVKETS